MSFETPFAPGIFEGTLTAAVHEHAGAPPKTIIRSNQTWAVNVRWETSGIANGMITGNWHLHVFLESVGTGPDLDLIDPADHVIPLTPNPAGPSTYARHFDVRSMDDMGVTIPAAGRLYKVVVSLTYREPGGGPGPMAAFVEGPVLQFYQP